MQFLCEFVSWRTWCNLEKLKYSIVHTTYCLMFKLQSIQAWQRFLLKQFVKNKPESDLSNKCTLFENNSKCRIWIFEFWHLHQFNRRTVWLTHQMSSFLKLKNKVNRHRDLIFGLPDQKLAKLREPDKPNPRGRSRVTRIS